ncbi:carboxylating nicotinate-nucleotide diphosphorylase [candidate division KSB1 bacterium]
MITITPEEHIEAHKIIKNAVREDIRTGDITTTATTNPRQKAKAVITAKSPGVLAGILCCSYTFSMINSNISMFFPVEDGSRIKKGQHVLEIRGSAAAILKAERTALNLLGRISGIATLTAKFVNEVKGTKAIILDTRKTMPGLRLFDKYAVRAGGGQNHRYALDDMFLIKENHIAAAGGVRSAVESCINLRKSRKLDAKIVIEASDIKSARTAADAGAERILLDNMNPDQIREAVKAIGNKIELEVSGGITLKNIRSYAETGVDFISIGMLTHSVKAVDFSLLLE